MFAVGALPRVTVKAGNDGNVVVEANVKAKYRTGVPAVDASG